MELYTYTAELTNIVDGDTYDFTVDLGFRVSKDIRVRMIGLDTAETYGVEKESQEYKEGMKHKRFVQEWFKQADEVFIKTEKDEKGKYGRWLVEVFDGSGESLNQTLVEEFPSVEKS
jgi:micrococcal nuclease